MIFFKRLKQKRQAKNNIKRYHEGCRDTMEIADLEKLEVVKTYEKKLEEKARELERKDEEIKKISKDLQYCSKVLEDQEQRLRNADAAFSLVLRTVAVQQLLKNTEFKTIEHTVNLARNGIARVLKKLPGAKKKIESKVNKVV